MISKLLPLLMGLAGTGAGVGAGLFLAPMEDPAEDTTQEPAAAAQETADAHGQKESHGSAAEYVKLSNQFVVPIVERDRVAAMVVLSLSLEVQPGAQEKIYSIEPKLRDGFLRVLFDHANMGGFGGTFTDADMLDVLRGALRDVARRDAGDAVRNVLIVDIARQDT